MHLQSLPLSSSTHASARVRAALAIQWCLSWLSVRVHNHLCFVRTVTSDADAVSRFHASQKLHNLLLFLQVWDSESLQQSHESCPSRLAQTTQVPFPDHFVSDDHRDRFRSAFGFVVDKSERSILLKDATSSAAG